MKTILALVAILVMIAAVGCSNGNMDADKIVQLNEALHAYPDTVEAWVIGNLDASVYATQRFGIGQPIWVMLHVEKHDSPAAVTVPLAAPPAEPPTE